MYRFLGRGENRPLSIYARTPHRIQDTTPCGVQEDSEILLRFFADALFLRDTGQILRYPFTDLNDTHALSMSS